jgi:ABC-type nitrate/sulfonate/bicarbonate transport system substrate-binding protein
MASIDTLWYTRCPVPTPLGIAAQLGWIDKEVGRDGITVRTLQDETDPALLESHFDHNLDNSIRQGGNIPAIWARSKGRQTRVVGLTWTDEAQVILVRPNSDIHSVQDLVGKKLGVATRPNDSIDFWKATTIRAYVATLEAHNLNAGDVNFVQLPREEVSNVGPAARRLRTDTSDSPESVEARALLNGDVDAIFHKGSRGLELADALGARILYDVGQHPDPKVRINNGSPRTFTVDAALIEKDLPLVARLVKQVILAGRWAEQNRDEAIAYVAKETRSSERAVQRAYGGNVNNHLSTDLESPSIDALANFTLFLHEWKFIPNNFDVREWIDPRPLQLALELLAREQGAPIKRQPQSAARTSSAL